MLYIAGKAKSIHFITRIAPHRFVRPGGRSFSWQFSKPLCNVVIPWSVFSQLRAGKEEEVVAGFVQDVEDVCLRYSVVTPPTAGLLWCMGSGA